MQYVSFSVASVTLDTSVLDALVAGAPAKAERAVETTAAQIETDTKLNIQQKHIIDTGALLNSIWHEKARPLVWAVGDGVPYGIYQELGTRFITARPFFIPAIEKNAEVLLDNLVEVVSV